LDDERGSNCREQTRLTEKENLVQLRRMGPVGDVNALTKSRVVSRSLRYSEAMSESRSSATFL